mmetsp:Transcript_40325/g.97387  ORF Transcript_40325/g.97387 Transcript_40325/m.97387 type:complete len:448 (+) Transcript_40325:129-1472(+)
MPCLIVTGYPSAGKTTLCHLLKERALLRQEIEDVQIVNEESACPDYSKNECYVNSLREKQTRAAMKSSFDRAVGITKTHNKSSNSTRKTLIILDSLNYIKGFRYELHCISKAAGEKHGILWVLNSMETVEQWNQSRSEDKAYQPALLKELIQRYEPPDDRNRWDKPLYTIDVTPSSTETNGTTQPESKTASDDQKTPQTTTANSKSEAVQNSVYNMHALGESLGDATTASATASTTASSSQPVTKGKKPKKSAFSRARKTAPKAAQQSKPNNLNTPPIASETTGTSSASESASSYQQAQSPLDQQEETQQQPPKPLEQQLDDILENFLLKVQSLKEGHSTRQHIAGDANVLQDLDSITQQVVSAINSAQNFHTGGETLQFQLPSKGSTPSQSVSLSLKGARQRVSLAELRRLRKQYLQWAGTHPPEDTSENGITNAFRLYLEEQLAQ